MIQSPVISAAMYAIIYNSKSMHCKVLSIAAAQINQSNWLIIIRYYVKNFSSL